MNGQHCRTQGPHLGEITARKSGKENNMTLNTVTLTEKCIHPLFLFNDEILSLSLALC